MDKKLNILGVIISFILLLRLLFYPNHILSFKWKLLAILIFTGVVVFKYLKNRKRDITRNN